MPDTSWPIVYFYDEPQDCVVRAVNTVDAVTATVPEIPFSVLCTIRDRIIATVPGVNRVLWDVSEKPVATIEWE